MNDCRPKLMSASEAVAARPGSFLWSGKCPHCLDTHKDLVAVPKSTLSVFTHMVQCPKTGENFGCVRSMKKLFDTEFERRVREDRLLRRTRDDSTRRRLQEGSDAI